MVKVFAIFACIVVAFVLSIAIGQGIFEATIDGTYNQYQLVAEGNINKSIDCLGNNVLMVNGYELNDNRALYAKRSINSIGAKRGDIRGQIIGGDCEYALYEGWYWGIGNFYYIEAK